MAATISTSSHLLLSGGTRSIIRLSPARLGGISDYKSLPCLSKKNIHCSGNVAQIRCAAVGTTSESETKKKSGYQIQTLTNWLLKQEQNGNIDAELTIVLSSISTACKQIASLVQRAGISNLTGVQGAVNIQGEDQKKLDVVSNESTPCAS